jgi:hypothetical protein
MAAYPHVEWLNLYNDGTVVECAVMKRDGLGNTHFIALKDLDLIDKRRLASILASRQATQFELWDLMSQVTLGNGVNALTYFHQYVKTRTSSGHIMTPTEGVMGAGQVGVKRVAPNPNAQEAPAQ